MKGKLAQYGAGSGAVATVLVVFDQVSAVEGLSPNMELGAKLIVGLFGIGLGAYLHSRQPPSS